MNVERYVCALALRNPSESLLLACVACARRAVVHACRDHPDRTGPTYWSGIASHGRELADRCVGVRVRPSVRPSVRACVVALRPFKGVVAAMPFNDGASLHVSKYAGISCMCMYVCAHVVV